jgi:hypothetical protein
MGCPLARQGSGLLVGGAIVALTWDEPMSGVPRPWFECPCCHGRCRHLYLRQMACRRCSRLDYSSRHLHRQTPAVHRIARLRRIGASLVPFSPIPPKPRYTTRYRVVAQIRALEASLLGHLRGDICAVIEKRIAAKRRPDCR